MGTLTRYLKIFDSQEEGGNYKKGIKYILSLSFLYIILVCLWNNVAICLCFSHFVSEDASVCFLQTYRAPVVNFTLMK
ncbi:MAG: hypothetical protein BWX96_03170 [Bacteroidetes bacterium ADurb.Bin145]|jgi:hypothetical protein|nr:MAG: hypothetical protein BWX96_03170 [Bacteroidetes bacterium ADurb.Bin145]